MSVPRLACLGKVGGTSRCSNLARLRERMDFIRECVASISYFSVPWVQSNRVKGAWWADLSIQRNTLEEIYYSQP